MRGVSLVVEGDTYVYKCRVLQVVLVLLAACGGWLGNRCWIISRRRHLCSVLRTSCKLSSTDYLLLSALQLHWDAAVHILNKQKAYFLLLWGY
jgi:hypothetical protein